MRAYGSTEARHECGTAVARNRAGVTSSRELQSNRTQMPSCGEVQTSRQQQGIEILGTPLGHHNNVQNHLERVADEHHRFMDMLPSVPNLQSSWLLLVHCASARANYLLRTVCPDSVWGFAEAHDRGFWECACTLLNIPSHQDQSTRDTATLPLSLGGLGLRSAVRTSPSAFWASWADCLLIISARHPAVADMIIRELVGHPVTPCLSAASRIARDLVGDGGFEPPSWISLANGARPHMRQPEDSEPGGVRQGWQHEAASRVERLFRDAMLMPRLASHAQALSRSQSGPVAGAPLTCVPTSRLLQFEPQLFRILLVACRYFGTAWVCG